MSPAAIIGAALAKGLDLIGICDHNSAENVPALVAAARGRPIAVLGGIEVSSREEVHVLGLFDDDEHCNAVGTMQQIVQENLPGENDERAFGEQVVFGEDGEVAGTSARLLIGATTLPIERVVKAIRDLGGLAVASHVDREGFGIIGQLGFVPEGLALDALELSPRAGGRERWEALSQETGLPLVESSDAHRLAEIGVTSTSFSMASPCIAEFRRALCSQEGRGGVV
jgi:hypothetical protein